MTNEANEMLQQLMQQQGIAAGTYQIISPLGPWAQGPFGQMSLGAAMQNVYSPDPRTPLQRLRDGTGIGPLTTFDWNRWRLTPIGLEYTWLGRAWGWCMAVIYAIVGWNA